MTDETYQKVCLIYNRLRELYEVKNEINDGMKNYLTYAFKIFGEKDEFCDDRIIKYIRALLDKHDKMIRQEIDDEIDKLKKQIAEL